MKTKRRVRNVWEKLRDAYARDRAVRLTATDVWALIWFDTECGELADPKFRPDRYLDAPVGRVKI